MLSQEVILDDNIQIACLPTTASSTYPGINLNSIAVGWGLTSDNSISGADTLRNVNLYIYNGSYCDYSITTNWNKQICVGNLTGLRAVCHGK